AGDLSFAQLHRREGERVEPEPWRQSGQHLARPRADQRRIGPFLADAGAEHLQFGPLGLQPFLEPIENGAGIAGRRRDDKPVEREAGADTVVEDHAVVRAHDAVAAAADRQALPTVDIDAVEQAAGVAAMEFDLAEGRGVEERDAVARGEALAAYRP